MRVAVIAGAAVLLAAAGTLIFLWNNRDETKIRRTLTALGEYVAKPRGEPPAAGTLKAAGLDKFLAAKVRFSSDDPRIEREFTPADLKPLFIQTRARCDTISVEWEIREIRIDGSRAEAECAIVLTGSGSGGAEKFTGLRQGSFGLEKNSGKWKIAQCTLSAPLK